MKNFNIFLLFLYYTIVCKFVYSFRVNLTESNTIDSEKEENNGSNDNTSVTKRRNPSYNEEIKIEEPDENINENHMKGEENITEPEPGTSYNSISGYNLKEKDKEDYNENNNLENFTSTKKSKLETTNNSNLAELTINETDFENAKKVCEFVVIKNEYFKNFCQNTEMFDSLENIKKTNIELYKSILNGSYDSDGKSKFELFKERDGGKIFVENDEHNPKVSLLFLFEKFCVGGVPLACSNILKYDNLFEVNGNNGINETNENESTEESIAKNDINKSDYDENLVEESISDLTGEEYNE